MTLATEVQTRYGAQFLVNLTNPGDTTTTTINTTTLGLAATDVEADFEIHVGVEFDASNALHVTVACEGVIAKLMERTGHAKAEDREMAYYRRLKSLGQVTARDRILPTSDSPYEPSVPNPDVTHRPAFDDEVFGGIIPGAPQ